MFSFSTLPSKPLSQPPPRPPASKLAEEAAALDYLGIPGLHIAGGQGIAIIAACQFFLMGGPEYARYVGLRGLEPVGIFLDGTGRAVLSRQPLSQRVHARVCVMCIV